MGYNTSVLYKYSSVKRLVVGSGGLFTLDNHQEKLQRRLVVVSPQMLEHFAAHFSSES